MKAVILAAGRGKRLSPWTDNRPKCMVEFAGKPLLVRQMAVLKAMDVSDITIVTGYRADEIENLGVRTIHNPRWSETNMVATLMCAAEVIDGRDDVLIAYADIVYESRVLGVIASSEASLSTAVDRGWRKLWEARGGDLLEKAETMKFDKDGYIIELGKKPKSLDDIEGQYIGLTKVSAGFCAEFVDRYQRLDPNRRYDGAALPNMYMTSYLQHLIECGVRLKAALVDHGWIEIDTVEDLSMYGEMLNTGALQRLYDPGR
ncbi:MAG: phosphocholine cytidylyltransferase family protein [Acidobacteria bacterium]|nr:phosphocholine cytidylyltransferase family protein [Acidobacteriota bacterium]